MTERKLRTSPSPSRRGDTGVAACREQTDLVQASIGREDGDLTVIARGRGRGARHVWEREERELTQRSRRYFYGAPGGKCDSSVQEE